MISTTRLFRFLSRFHFVAVKSLEVSSFTSSSSSNSSSSRPAPPPFPSLPPPSLASPLLQGFSQFVSFTSHNTINITTQLGSGDAFGVCSRHLLTLATSVCPSERSQAGTGSGTVPMCALAPALRVPGSARVLGSALLGQAVGQLLPPLNGQPNAGLDAGRGSWRIAAEMVVHAVHDRRMAGWLQNWYSSRSLIAWFSPTRRCSQPPRGPTNS